MIKKITFKNYKSFKEEQELELKPITVLIGKNSSGKSAVAKLPVLIDNSFNNVSGEPYTIDYNDVQFGDEYRDVFYERVPNALLEFKLTSESGFNLEVKLVSDFEKNTIPTVFSWKLGNEIELVYNSIDGTYTNILNGKVYRCEFNGFELTELLDKNGAEVEESYYLSDIQIRTDYIGPFRVYANQMRSFQLRSYKNLDTVGTSGEGAYYILGLESLKTQSELLKAVSDWYKKNFNGWGIKINNDLQPFCRVELTREDRKFNVNIADVGQGMSQALPLVVNAFLPSNKYLTIIEQPELHLHPAAHGNLAQLFAESAIKFNKKYLIETHSQNFVLRLRRMIAEGKFDHNDLQIYWIDYDGDKNVSSIKTINVNQFGEVDFWPENIFSETLDETIAMRTAQVKGKMIIEFHPGLFQNIANRQRITFMLYLCYFDRRYEFFIDLSQIETSPIYNSLSFEDKSLIEEYFNRFVNDSNTVNFLISTDNGDYAFDLDEARLYFDQPLLIILENSLNDKYFLEALANKFPKRGKTIRRHLELKWIDIVNGGGCDNIINVVTEKLSTFTNKSKTPETYLRCFVIVDSDSTYPGEIKPTRTKLKEFLDNKGIVHHILLKREMENYLPDDAFKEVVDNEDYIAAYLRLDPIQRDYFDIEKGFERNLTSYIQGVQDLYANVSQSDMGSFRKGGMKMADFKATFPKLFQSKSVTRENLKQRTEHQGTLSNELEIILDKITGLL